MAFIYSTQLFTYSSCHKDGALARAEDTKSILSLTLASVTMNARHGVSMTVQELLKGICTLFGLNEH